MDKKVILINSLIVLFLSFFVVMVGVYIVSFFAAASIPYGVHLGELNLGEKTIKDATNLIDEYFPDFIKKRSVTVSIEGKTFIIPMEDINLHLDKQESMNRILGKSKFERLRVRVKGIFGREKRIVAPVFTCDEKLLSLKIIEMKGKMDKASLDATLFMKGEVVEKKPEIVGIEMSLENTVNTITKNLENGVIGPIILKAGANLDYKIVLPQATMDIIQDITGVIGKGISDINDLERMESIKLASKAINGIFIGARNGKESVKPAEFSFYKSLEDAGLVVTQYNPGVNQVASTMYSALIKSGCSSKDMDIIADIDAAEYQPNMKRIKVSGTLADFKYRNNTDTPIVIKSDVKDRSIVVYILGKKE